MFIYGFWFVSWKMRFGEIYSKSWKEFKSNRPALFKIVFWFYALPALLIYLIDFFWLNSNGVYARIVELINTMVASQGYNATLINRAVSNLIGLLMGPSYSIVMAILMTVSGLLMLLALSSLVSGSLKNGKLSFSEALKLGKKNYWRLLAFMIVYIVFLLGLTILLIIPGFIFLVFWIFGYFVFIDEGNGIIKALKRSYHIVRGRWWKTLGYMVLIDLILILIMIIFMIPSFVTQGIMSVGIVGGHLSVGSYLANMWVSNIFQLLAMFIVLPLSILFLKNMYLEWKKGK